MKFFQGCLNGLLIAIPIWAVILLVIWFLSRCEMVERNLLTRLVRLLLNRVRSWWYVDQVNDKDIRKRRAQFVSKIRTFNNQR